MAQPLLGYLFWYLFCVWDPFIFKTTLSAPYPRLLTSSKDVPGDSVQCKDRTLDDIKRSLIQRPLGLCLARHIVLHRNGQESHAKRTCTVTKSLRSGVSNFYWESVAKELPSSSLTSLCFPTLLVLLVKMKTFIPFPIVKFLWKIFRRFRETKVSRHHDCWIFQHCIIRKPLEKYEEPSKPI